eukprot:Skav234021  [mRNA]  locus=scaffold2538:193989:194923:- [translate_table: standard]
MLTIQSFSARGLLSMGQESWDRGKELVEQHSKPIQEGPTEAWQKEVVEKTESLQQNLHESFGQNALKIKAGIDKGGPSTEGHSCPYWKPLDIWMIGRVAGMNA